MAKHRVSVTVNGATHEREVEDRLLLVHFIREDLSLTGTHIGCDTTQCGACTILMDGEAVKSCTIFTVQADGAQIQTVEGLAQGDTLAPVQEGFWEEHGLQCGYCTPGMLMTAQALLAGNSDPSEAEIRHALHGNLCRCTGYEHIVNAVQYAARRTRGEEIPAPQHQPESPAQAQREAREVPASVPYQAERPLEEHRPNT